MEIRKICILGGGNLGSRIALQAAMSKLKVTVFDLDLRQLDQSLASMRKLFRQQSRPNLLSNESESTILARIQFTLDPVEAVRDVDLISENVTEKLHPFRI